MFEKYKIESLDLVDIYAYAPPNCGKVQYGDAVIDFGKDLRTLENYKNYKDCGFNVLFTQNSAKYQGEEFETSEAKMVLDLAYQSGIKKVILLDERILQLSRIKDGIIGENKKFKDEKELDDFIANCLKPYQDHPAFYGVQFVDEPHYYLFKSMGELYRSIKRVRKETYVQVNLLPLDTLRWMDERYPQGGDLIERRKKYLEMFLNETGADYILYDDYPFCYHRENKTNYLRCLQTSAEVCRDRNVNFCFVAQSFSMSIGINNYYYVPSEREAMFQIHLLMGFGLKGLSYFTYMPHGCGNLSGERFPSDGTLIDGKGNLMPQYYWVQKAIAEYKKLLPILYHFDYVGSSYDVATFNTWLKPLDYCVTDKFNKVISFETDFEGVMINELKDKENGNYLYRVINVTDSNEKQFADVIQKTTIKFKDDVKQIDVYKNGSWSTLKVTNGCFVAELLAGEALYILI